MSRDLNISKDITILSQEDTYSLVLLLLYVCKDNPRYSTLNELAYILDHDSFMNFIKYYEGQTIQIPPIDEILDSLRLLALFQYYKVEKLPWKDSLELAGYNSEEGISAKHKLIRFIKHIDKYKYRIGGLLNAEDKK